MPGVALCENKACPKRMSCFRYRSKPTAHRQVYITFEPDADGHCESFMALWAEVRPDKIRPIEECE